MGRVWYRSIAIDRCENCRGLWFDTLEAEWLRAEVGSEAIDTGDSQIGAQQNRIGLINCPICKIPMIRMVDAGQPHIWYEKCSSCSGIYFDAGEFKDYKDYDTSDLIKSLFFITKRKY
jgi:uncharacterized protein